MANQSKSKVTKSPPAPPAPPAPPTPGEDNSPALDAAKKAMDAASMKQAKKQEDKGEAEGTLANKFSRNNDGRIQHQPVDGDIMVRATKKGYYGGTRIQPGQVFGIHEEQDFSKNWMEYADEIEPKKKK